MNHLQNESPTIYLDMDGVLVDFERGSTTILGRPFNSFKGPVEREMRNKLTFDAGVHFWAHLPPMQDYLTLYNYVRFSHPHILTAVPSGTGGGHDVTPTEEQRRFASEGKWEWIKAHLPDITRDRFHAVLRMHKQNYATKVVGSKVVSNILIDDNLNNVMEFHRNRGIGIQHKSAAETIAQLRNLGFKNPMFSRTG